MTPQAVDRLCLLVAVILPIPLVLRYNLIGVVLGTLVVWGSLFVAGLLLSALDPTRDAGILDGIWLLFGWLGGLMYCLPIYAVKRIVISLWRAAHGPVRATID
jgi:hypothetical protein